MSLTDFSTFDFVAERIKHKVYKLGGGSSPGVLIIQELPGIGEQTIALARRLHADGFTVYLPHLFGKFNAPVEPLKNLGRLCINLEFRLLANRRRSPISNWLRALSRQMQDECDGPVGAIGMCLTGGFVLTLMMDSSIAAPVMSQPSHAGGVGGKARQETLGVPAEDLNAAVARAKKDGVDVLGLRFTNDPICTNARFNKMEELFGEHFRRFEIDSSLFNEWGNRLAAHSVLTLDFKDEPNHPTVRAYDHMVEFFHEKLES